MYQGYSGTWFLTSEFRVKFYILNNKSLTMAMEHGFSPREAPSSISIKLGQVKKKEADVCIFDGCERGKRGYSDYCRKHKAIGKIVEGKIAREKALNVDPSISMYEESLRIQESESLQIPESSHLKSSNHCKLGDCQNQRKGYSDFCREHKAIGKIISGKIAREKAIAKIAERDNQGQVTETNPSYSSSITINADNSEEDSLFIGSALIFSLITMVFVFASDSPTEDEIYSVACFALPVFCLSVVAAIKEPLTRLLVMTFLIPITVFLMFHIFLAMLFADLGSGGCYGVCGLSGWGGP